LETISQTRIQAKILSILGTKIDGKADYYKAVKFNVSANLEELEHGMNRVALGFTFTIITEPKVVKYQVDGRTEIQGQADQIKRVLAPNPTTRVPIILKDVYQQVYPQIFVLSKMIDAPCPTPDLLSTSQPAASKEREVSSEIPEESAAVDEVSDSLPEEIEQPRKKSAKRSHSKVSESPSEEVPSDKTDVEVPVSQE
jgi:hypothetical protein